MGCSTLKEENENEIEEQKDEEYSSFPKEKNAPSDIYKIKLYYNSSNKSNQKTNNNKKNNNNSNIKSNKNKNNNSNIKTKENLNVNSNQKNKKQNYTIMSTKESKSPLYKIDNKINFTLEIKKGKLDKKDYLQKDIYFIDNTDYRDINGFKHFHDSLRELNQSNAELIINRVKYPFQKFFRFKEEGTYNITLNLKIALTDCSNMFHGSKYLTKIDLSSFETRFINRINGMFWGCENLKYLNLSEINVKNVTDMSFIFNNCTKLLNINLSLLDTENVTDMSYMFNNCENLTKINLYNLNTENVLDMSHMFDHCSKLSNIDISTFDTKNVTNMSNMFSNCLEILEIDLSKLNTQNVTDMSHMFLEINKGCNLICNDNVKKYKKDSFINSFDNIEIENNEEDEE